MLLRIGGRLERLSGTLGQNVSGIGADWRDSKDSGAESVEYRGDDRRDTQGQWGRICQV